MKSNLFRILFAVLFTTSATLSAQEASIHVERSVDTVRAGQVFQLRVSIENHQGHYSPPDFSRLKIVGGPNHSSQFSMINGEVKRKITYSYHLIAPEAGVYKLGTAGSEDGGLSLRSEEIVLHVLPPHPGLTDAQDGWHSFGQSEQREQREQKPKLNTRKF